MKLIKNNSYKIKLPALPRHKRYGTRCPAIPESEVSGIYCGRQESSLLQCECCNKETTNGHIFVIGDSGEMVVGQCCAKKYVHPL